MSDTSTKHYNIKKHIQPTQHIRQYRRATRKSSSLWTPELRIVFKQYTPKTNPHPRPGDVTIIAAHANGVSKELYEPMFDDLYEKLQGPGKGYIRIRAIWIADVAWQGESSVLNESILGNDPSWYDHPRDLLLFINNFRQQLPQPLFGLGHSMGGNNVVNLALTHPSLFAGLILIDPVIQKAASLHGNQSPAYMSTLRRDIWPSREEAAQGMKKNPFYKRYDPRVFDRHVKYCFRDLPTAVHPHTSTASTTSKSASASLISAAATSAAAVPPDSPAPRPVTLTTPKHQEVFTFSRPSYPPTESPSPSDVSSSNANTLPRHTHPDITENFANANFYSPAPIITFHNLPYLRPRVLYVFAEESFMSAPEMQKDKMEATGVGVGGSRWKLASDTFPDDTETAVQSITIQEAGHFVPFEKPQEVAGHIGEWLEREVDRWWRIEEMEEKAWEAEQRSEGGRGGFIITERFRDWMQADAEAMGLAKPKRKSKETKL